MTFSLNELIFHKISVFLCPLLVDSIIEFIGKRKEQRVSEWKRQFLPRFIHKMKLVASLITTPNTKQQRQLRRKYQQQHIAHSTQ